MLRNGHLVSRASDYIIYSVEASAIGRVVAEFGPSTKENAIVGGQTSCKDPEIKAFEAHLPSDVDIVTCHSLHGPGIDPHGQPLVIIRHRASTASLEKVLAVLSCLGSKHVHLSADEHDRITADTQAVTHAAFLSMGSAWHASGKFPWEEPAPSAAATTAATEAEAATATVYPSRPQLVGGIENAKINLMLRIYAQKWHVYAGLAILNPQARRQIEQYASSVTSLFKLMIGGREAELRARVHKAKDKVFGTRGEGKWEERALLRDDVLDRFSLRGRSAGNDPPVGNDPAAVAAGKPIPNNHLSLLAMVDSWAELGIVPYDHMICSTPLFRLWLGVTESLFRNEERLDEALTVAVHDTTFRSDDLEFAFAARAWSEAVGLGNFDGWRERFVRTQKFFEPRFEGNIEVGNAMVKAVLESMRRDNL